MPKIMAIKLHIAAFTILQKLILASRILRGAFFIAISGGVNNEGSKKTCNKKSITTDLKLSHFEFKSGG